jgi:hypothetical protein
MHGGILIMFATCSSAFPFALLRRSAANLNWSYKHHTLSASKLRVVYAEMSPCAGAMPGTGNNIDPGATAFRSNAVCVSAFFTGRDYEKLPAILAAGHD